MSASIGAVDSARARAGYTAQAFLTRSSARGDRPAPGEAMRLEGEREGLLRRLGGPYYAGADGGAERGAIAAWTSRIAALERRPGDRNPRAEG